MFYVNIAYQSVICNIPKHGTQVLIKLLAVIGFFAVVALIAWLGILGIRMFPTAFSSLATIAETINDYRLDDELVIEIEKNIVNSGRDI